MACTDCKDGKPCATCQLKDMGFVHKDGIEELINKKFQEKTNGTSRPVQGNADGEPRYTVSEFLHHFDDPNCTGNNCAIHKRKTALLDQGAEMGVEAGLNLAGAIK